MKKGVYLIGAGPGDVKLITVKAKEILNLADAIIYDELANSSLLNDSKKECEKIYVGKKAGNHTMPQEKINELLLEMSKKHRIVARLKGGDPYVFGRGSEEAEFLNKNDVYFEVVPGISSAIGGLAAANIPVTARNIATSFHVITGHLSKESENIDFNALAKLKGTLIFLMGMSNLSLIVENLIKAGMSKDAKVAIVYQATTLQQKEYIGTLSNIVEIKENNNIESPAIIVVGEVVNYNEILKNEHYNYYKKKKVVITRDKESSKKFIDIVEELGLAAISMPTIRFVEINKESLVESITNINDYEGIIFTSPVAVDIFMNAFLENNIDIRRLAKQKITVIGEKTKKALLKYGICPDFMPAKATSEGLLSFIEEQKDQYSKGKYLFPRSSIADECIVEQLGRYLKVEILNIYETITDTESYYSLDEIKNADYITFTSASTFKGFVSKLEASNIDVKELIKDKKIVAIGPITKKAINDYGIKVDLIPNKSTVEDMANIIAQDNQKERL